MKKIVLLALLMSAGLCASAQWVTIPDANFANKLNELFPGCMDGDQMDTTCLAIINTNSLNVGNNYSSPDSIKISDLTGLQYFSNLETLDCGWNALSELPELPNSISELYCGYNVLSDLPVLPNLLTVFECNDNNLIELPLLPSMLIDLRCDNNDINALPDLPASLSYLNCSSNDLSALPALPNSLLELTCKSNNLTELSQLPPSLIQLDLLGNELTELPELPVSLELLVCHMNNISELPDLPSSLLGLDCQVNNLTYLPELPESLIVLWCGFNELIELPELPSELQGLTCNYNQLSCLPTLPASLIGSGVYGYFNISNNFFTCVPNYVQAMGDEWLAYPLCEISDPEDNPFGCSSLEGITGTIFKDNNTNCTLDENENGLSNIPVHLLDSEENLVATTYSFSNTAYNFVADTGDYTVQIVVDNQPYQPSCSDPGIEQEVELSGTSPSAIDVDFGVDCLTGFDIGTQSISTWGWVFPGEEHILNISAGDLSNWYGLQCAEGVGGSVIINISGPVSYVDVPINALIPVVSGDIQLNYDIDDFGVVDFEELFDVILETDTAALEGDSICVEVIVNPITGDSNPENNTYSTCYQVTNSYDPNIKQVWPQDVAPGYDGYFTYTVYFQNTGNAPAFNIEILDTLDSNLDWGTFELTGYSHACYTTVTDSVARFYFNNIMLPDSTSDFDGSIGYVQYRIKPIADLQVGTIIENTAHIFFDFNDAIVTNTTQNEYVITTSANQPKQQLATVFPNPGSGQFNVLFRGVENGLTTHLEVYNLSGQRVLQRQVNQNRVEVDLTEYPSGMYLLHMRNERGSEAVKLMKQ